MRRARTVSSSPPAVVIRPSARDCVTGGSTTGAVAATLSIASSQNSIAQIAAPVRAGQPDGSDRRCYRRLFCLWASCISWPLVHAKSSIGVMAAATPVPIAAWFRDCALSGRWVRPLRAVALVPSTGVSLRK